LRSGVRLAAALVLIAVCDGCGGSDAPYRKETFPVNGQVVVDGVPPSSPVSIVCHDVKGMDQQHPSVSQTMTGAEGRFEVSTYETGDGVPAGDYALTFEWGQINLVSMQYGGPDKLGGRYSDPTKSEFRFKVTDGPVDLGRLELKTK
jgi:hypothetical protein